MDSGEDSPGFKVSGLAEKVLNVDGRILTKDGVPMLPRRNLLFNTCKPGGQMSDSVYSSGDPKADVAKPVNSEKGNLGINSKEKDEMVNPDGSGVKLSYAAAVSPAGLVKPRVNFRLLESGCPSDESAEVLIPLSSVAEANARFEHTLYGYFLGKRVAFPVVEQYVKNSWKKYGISNVMMNANGFFFFKFCSASGLEGVLEHGPWAIRSSPIILKKWSPNVTLAKEDLASVPVWVKFHDVPIAAFTADGLSVIASKLGTPIMLDSYTSAMCMSSWGRLDFARALIDVRADRVPKDSLVIAIPSEKSQEVSLHKVKVEFEWKPPRCKECIVFGHTIDSCPKIIKPVTKKEPEPQTNLAQKPRTAGHAQSGAYQPKPFRGLLVGNQKKVSMGRNKKAYVPKVHNKEASKIPTSNPFETLNKIDPKVDPSTSASKVVDPLVEDSQEKERGKAKVQESADLKGGSVPSLYQQWKDAKGDQPWNEVDSDEDEVMDPFDYDMSEFMDLHERQGRNKR